MAVTINGTTGITNTGDYDAEDNDKLLIGAGDDLQIYHDGSDSNITNTTGNLILQGDSILLKNNGSTESYIRMADNGSVDLYYDNNKKFETTASGIEITGGGVTIPNGWNTQWGVNASRAFIQGEDANGNNRLILGTNNTERLRILSGGGLTFNGDTAAANALNDYEEGSFTATAYSSGGTQQPLNSSIDAFSYIKIGSMVYIQGRINFASGTPDGTGALKLGGLPFTTSNTLAEQGAMHHIAINTHGISLPGTAIATFMEFTNNSTWMYAMFQKDNAGWSAIDVSYCDNGDYIALSGCYITDS